jgi:hypothetical protein
MPPKKTQDSPYLKVAMAKALHHGNMSVGVHDVHLPDGWLLKARKVLVPPVSLHGRKRRDEICRRPAARPNVRHGLVVVGSAGIRALTEALLGCTRRR